MFLQFEIYAERAVQPDLKLVFYIFRCSPSDDTQFVYPFCVNLVEMANYLLRAIKLTKHQCYHMTFFKKPPL